ncbi:hypothetical protein MBSD_n1571 [Mizugakiibacter sediminis]|uniref:Uncharacterized protein n=1 Tax=Mizugakiibacter sediminis TaxID=1475481 RepID=A0A0K8QPD2_9GAMM|nr:hypothetical protein MBSD_n1571 [Mizugakiibacter sediminis]
MLARLEALRAAQPRIVLQGYGGELSDPDLLANLVRSGPAVLVTVPKVTFERRAARRFGMAITFRLVMAMRHPRSERDTRRGNATGVGTYALWASCMQLLAGWQPWADRPGCEPTEFNNLVSGSFQSDHLSVLGQTFRVANDWSVPEPTDALPIAGIDLSYYLQPDDGQADAADRVDPPENP